MSLDDWLIHGTALVALTFYTAALAWRLTSRLARARLAWTAGFVVFLLHVVFAFGLRHHWSHDDAYRATAERTAEVVGWTWGGGLYANYAFTFVWLVDLLEWWRDAERHERRSPTVNGLVHGFLGFMAFNATVVFGQWPARSLGVLACAGLLAVWLSSRRRRELRLDSST